MHSHMNFVRLYISRCKICTHARQHLICDFFYSTIPDLLGLHFLACEWGGGLWKDKVAVAVVCLVV